MGLTRHDLEGRFSLFVQLLAKSLWHEEVMGVFLISQEILSVWSNGGV